MTLRYLGELSLGQAMPLAALVNAALVGAVGVGIGQLRAKLEGLARMQVALTVGPPTIAATIEGAIKTVARLEASIGGPVITLQVAAIVALIGELTAQIGVLNAQLALQFPLGGNVHLYSFDGRASELGPQLTSATAGGFPGGAPTDHANALVIATVEPATWLSMQAVFST